MFRKFAAGLFALTVIATPALAIEAKAVNNVDHIALKGFDPVAYFVDDKPEKGNPEITSKDHGVIYEFTSKDHKALFDKDPAKYVPAYNGFCAYGVSEGLKIDVDPHAYAINDGKLNVFFSGEARDAYQSDLANKSKESQAKWPTVRNLTKVVR